MKSIDHIKNKVFSGKRLTRKDGIDLFKSNDLLALGRIASCCAAKEREPSLFCPEHAHQPHEHLREPLQILRV